jgi:hypothetical protein
MMHAKYHIPNMQSHICTHGVYNLLSYNQSTPHFLWICRRTQWFSLSLSTYKLLQFFV